MQQQGFTLVELIAILILVAILATVSTSRFANNNLFAVQAARDDIVAGLFFAQQAAIARDSNSSGPNITFVANTDAIDVQQNGRSLLNSVYPLSLRGVTLNPTPLTLNYDKLGRTSATTLTITGSDGSNATITVEASGYAH